jgi:hypothetical protein
VGSGESINIWKDSWIPSSPNRKILSPRSECILTKVHELIDPSSGTWDEDLIRSIFHQVNAQRILLIPLTSNGFNDFIAWHYNRSGVFSVKSAYHVEWKHQFNGVTCRSLISGAPLNNPMWKNLWKLEVPAKVKIYCWRIMHGIISLKAILFSRHIGDSGICPICNIEDEDVLHMLFNCQGAANIGERWALRRRCLKQRDWTGRDLMSLNSCSNRLLVFSQDMILLRHKM